MMFAACIAKAIALYRGSILATGDMVQDHLRWTLKTFPRLRAWLPQGWASCASIFGLFGEVFQHFNDFIFQRAKK
ncbi:MAG: hypothetical protein WBX78_25910, partial [Pseudolabrys sp.]